MNIFKKNYKTNGFTIIEVLIVLAIAGLIILIIFLAVPALQRNARNYQRRQDVAKTLVHLQEVANLNYGTYPNSCNNLQNTCFVREVELSYCTWNKDKKQKAISYQKGFAGGHQLDAGDTSHPCAISEITGNSDPTPSPGGEMCGDTEMISLRSHARCGPDNEIITYNATNKSVAAQFTVETANGFVRQCQEG